MGLMTCIWETQKESDYAVFVATFQSASDSGPATLGYTGL